MMYRVTARGLNLRESPRMGSRIARELPRHTAFKSIGRTGDWLRARTFDGSDGWVWGSYAVPDPAPWLTVAEEEARRGVSEVAGAKHNPRILEYHGTTTLQAMTDEIPWCSSFVNWTLLHTGILGTRLANARSWLQWGRAITVPLPGCVAILSRGADVHSGHVGFYTKRNKTHVYLLGGNQSDRVCEAPYRLDRVLGYRWPVDVPLPAVDATQRVA